jgi:hypothetical protein
MDTFSRIVTSRYHINDSDLRSKEDFADLLDKLDRIPSKKK